MPGLSTFWGGCLLSWCGLIFLLSSQSALPAPEVFDSQDKLIHAMAYAVMAWLFWGAWKPALAENLSLLAILAVVFCSAYGASDEWHQSFVQGRDASVYDWLADTSGALLLSILFWNRSVAMNRNSEREIA